MSTQDLSSYRHKSTASHSTEYLRPVLFQILKPFPPPLRIFELGCGNGANAEWLALQGYDVLAVDPSESGISRAQARDTSARFALGSAYDDLASQYGRFDLVVSLEVVEHVFYPRQYAATVKSLLNPGGVAIISTPYHGYLKNLALALTNKMDAHFTALWDYGHIKFWSRPTLAKLFAEVGMLETAFYRVGRVPQLAKSMISVFEA